MLRIPGRSVTLRLPATVLAAAALGGGSTLQGWLPVARPAAEPATPPELASLPLEEAIDPNRFVLESPRQSVVGVPQVVFTRADDTLADFALEYGVGYDELIAANPDVDRWLPGENTAILLPTQFVLPEGPREGVVLNIAAKRLYYFPADGIEVDPLSGEVTRQAVLTFPIGIGRVGWETPIGETTVVSKAKDPTWWVPASVRKEHAEMGDPLPAIVPPGPDNPLGTRVLKLDMPGYLIHGTNMPYGVGMRVSHGCVRLYPENIEFLYELVPVGERVRIVNEPYLLGRLGEDWYFQSYAPLEDDTIDPALRLDAIITAAGELSEPALADHMRAIASTSNGLPIRIAKYDQGEVLARLRRVHNTVETDPDAPTLEEVREMIDEVLEAVDAETTAMEEGR
jgi:L,D-transpeptidase ErfK/SrfK